MNPKNRKLIGVVCVLTAAVIWGIEPILVRYAADGKVSESFLHTATVRAFFISLIGAAYALFRHVSFKIKRIQLSSIVLTAVVASVVADLIYYYCIGIIPVVNVVLLGHLQPVFIVILGFFFLKGDKLSAYDYSGMTVMLASAVVVVARTPSNLVSFQIGSYGDLMLLGATVLWASGSIIMRRSIEGLDSGVICAIRFAVALVFYLVFSAAKGDINVSYFTGINHYEIALGALIGIGYILYYEGLIRIKAAQVGALELAGPVFGAFFGLFFFGEMITLFQCAGMIFLFPGIWLLSKRES